jgi:heptosyltransferase-2
VGATRRVVPVATFVGAHRDTPLFLGEMYRKILIRMPNWIGDAVLAMPAVGLLRRRFPDAELVALAVPIIGELLYHHPDLDRVSTYDRTGEHAGLAGRLRMIRTLHAERFDLCVLFSNAFESALIARLAGIPDRLGYRRDGRGFLLNRGIAVPNKKLHQRDYYLHLVEEGLGADDETPRGNLLPTLWLLPEERESAPRFLSSISLNSPPSPLPPIPEFVGLNPGAAYGSSKRWEPARFAEVADRLAASHGVRIVVFGGAGDRETAREIAEAMKQPPVLLAGSLSLRESMALLSRCRLLITNDSGPMHIAAAFGVPLVAVFGPTDPQVTSPVGEGHRTVRVGVECAPCRYRTCPIDHRCMVRLTPDSVYEAAAGLLARPRPSGSPVVFLDRDGTINRDKGYIDRPERLELFPGAAAAIGRLNRAGLRVIVVTNQSGVGRGYYTIKTLEKIHRRLNALLAEEGARLDGIYACPHAPERRACRCRKPAPGMLLRAIQDASPSDPIDLSRAYVVGDKEIDLLLGKAIGGRSILVRTGYGKETEAKLAALGLEAVPVANELSEAVDLILEEVKRGAENVRREK